MPRVTDEHRQKQADRIITAAEACFARNGFHATSMDQIIAEVDMSSSTVYRYFEGKRQIIQEVSRRRITPVVDALRDAAAANTPPSPEAVVGGIVDRLLPDDAGQRTEGAPPSAVLAVNAWAETARDQSLADTIRGNLAETHRLATTLVRRWQEAGQMTTSLSADELAHFLQQSLFGQIATVTVTGSAAAPSLATALSLLRPAGT
ncbi:TetR/AcrR family transcriptional regulator [Corynebacterium kalidii]|uniref:TetR/AcrR family transcriptional regulator n=1 Tax=Corynebacterium kalidii TaxID=2931982 RepID=A0A9X2B1L7_9CORY|nr:TetR/AcrR family transcriptional regulator [Corynebacterium kalidii]MCJ7858179.1 TetR/AcrR family transcriptional regulator [Corynebacterium kalidii]